MNGALQVGSIRAIPIRVHWTFLLVLPLLALLFAGQLQSAAEMAGVAPERLSLGPWLWGLLVAVGLFASVLVHELAHSLYALRVGLRVRGITLLLIGGISEIVDPPRKPGQEALMALVGPLTSLVLGGAFTAVGWLLSSTAAPTDLVFGLLLLGELNLVLGVFNLLPAFPMDGGRILRAALTPSLGALRATRVAGAVGKGFAVVFAVAGLLGGSILLVLVAFFVWMGASAEGAQVALREVLAGQPVGDLMAAPTPGVDALTTLDAVAAGMREARRLVLPVFEGDAVLGMLTLDALRSVPAARWPTTLARQVVRPVSPVAPTDDAWTALQRMAACDVAELPVVEDGVYIGVVSQADILRGVRLRELETAWAEARSGPLRRSPFGRRTPADVP